MKSVCVYLGSNYGDSDDYRLAAEATGRLIARRGMTLVYGGSNVGLMKVLADSTLAEGGEVVGVTTRRFVERGVAHPGLSELHVTEDMHLRKAMMRDRAEAFITLPGGVGTLEELLETMTLGYLDIHAKPSGLLNLNGYWDPLLEMLTSARGRGFLARAPREILLTADDPARLLEMLEDQTRGGSVSSTTSSLSAPAG